jgi:hypothetical protein
VTDIAIEPKRAPGRRPRPLSTDLSKLVRKKPRKRFRSVPPPFPFDIDTLPNSTRVTSIEAAAIIRRPVTALETWRRIPNHPLRWRRVGGRILYDLGSIREFLKGDANKQKVGAEK